MSVTIRIPTVKHLVPLINELQELNFNYDVDVTVSIDRWSDELELDAMSNHEESNVTRIHDLMTKHVESKTQMEQLRKHLRGE